MLVQTGNRIFMTLLFWQSRLFHIKLHGKKGVRSWCLTKGARNIKYLFIGFNSFSDKKSWLFLMFEKV